MREHELDVARVSAEGSARYRRTALDLTQQIPRLETKINA
jgi:hypothetical protein